MRLVNRINIILTKNIISLFRILAISLAVLHTLAAIKSQSMNPDGISYLDIGDAYFRGDWENAINPVWPPLYSWLLGFANAVIKPTMEWEFPLVHMVNFVIFLTTLLSFEYFWKRLRIFRTQTISNDLSQLPDWAWWSIGYSLFIWTSQNLIQIWAVTPDMLMATFLYLAAGLVTEIRTESQHWLTFLSLGFVLGLGYLTKTFMLSISLFIFFLLLFLPRLSWKSIGRTILASSSFLLVCLPFILLISNKLGKLSYGEAGTVTYMRYVYGIPFPHFQGDESQGIRLSHPSRLINQAPNIYEFSEPIGGTYPIGMDPSYWYDGIEMRINANNQLARFYLSLLFYFDIFFLKQGVLVACVVALLVKSSCLKISFTEFIGKWALSLSAFLALGLYSLVLVSGRYIGVFIMLFWSDILANIRIPNERKNKQWIDALCLIAVAGLLINVLLFNLDGIVRLNPAIQSEVGEQMIDKPAPPLEVAQELRRLDIRPGDKVSVIGYGFDSFWARLARVKIVSEMLADQAKILWNGDEVMRQNVLEKFYSTGSKVVVAENVPAFVEMNGWFQVGNSNYYIFFFEE